MKTEGKEFIQRKCGRSLSLSDDASRSKRVRCFPLTSLRSPLELDLGGEAKKKKVFLIRSVDIGHRFKWLASVYSLEDDIAVESGSVSSCLVI